MHRHSEHIEQFLLEVYSKTGIRVEGTLLNYLLDLDSGGEFKQYLEECKENDNIVREKRLNVTRRVQVQNDELRQKQEQNQKLLLQLETSLHNEREAAKDAERAKYEAERLKEQAVDDLEVLQRKKQFGLVSLVVRLAVFVILGVGITTSALYAFVLHNGFDSRIIESTWSNLFGILLTNSFSIIGTIMGVKYVTDKD